MSEATDVVILEEAFDQPPDIPDVGCEIQFATLFGKCSYMIRKDQVRDLEIANIHQLSYQDSVSIVIKSAIQRGMAMAEIKRKGSTATAASNETSENNILAKDEPIIQEVMKLASVSLAEKELKEINEMFEGSSKRIQFILSNEKARFIESLGLRSMDLAMNAKKW